MKEEPIIIGRIIGTHGLAGALKVLPLTSFPKRFETLQQVTLEDAQGNKGCYHIQSLRYQGEVLLVQFKGLSSVSQVQPFVNGNIQIDSEELVTLPKGNFYHFDLLGMQVFTEEGKWIGELKDIFSTGSNDVYVVKQGSREHLIPAIREVIREVDVPQKKMKIHVLEGLLEND